MANVYLYGLKGGGLSLHFRTLTSDIIKSFSFTQPLAEYFNENGTNMFCHKRKVLAHREENTVDARLKDGAWKTTESHHGASSVFYVFLFYFFIAVRAEDDGGRFILQEEEKRK